MSSEEEFNELGLFDEAKYRNIGVTVLSSIPMGVNITTAALRDPRLAANLTWRAAKFMQDKWHTNKAYEVLQTGYGEETPVLYGEIALPVDRPADVPQLEDDICAMLKHIDSGLCPHTSPALIRFVRTTDSLLAMESGIEFEGKGYGEKLWCLIDSPVVVTSETLKLEKKAMELMGNMWIERMKEDGVPRRPHWGKCLSFGKDEFQMMYSSKTITQWNNTRKLLNGEESRFFLNDLFRSLLE